MIATDDFMQFNERLASPKDEDETTPARREAAMEWESFTIIYGENEEGYYEDRD